MEKRGPCLFSIILHLLCFHLTLFLARGGKGFGVFREMDRGWDQNDQDASPLIHNGTATAVPIVVLKNGRSGSTWFQEMLSMQPVSCIFQEIITKSMSQRITTGKKIQRMERVLKTFERSPQLCSEMIGFTACPMLPTGEIQPDFMEIMSYLQKRHPRLRVIIFSRSNVIRTAVASHSTKGRKEKKEVQAECKSKGKSCCRISYPIQAFQCEFPHVMKWHEHLLKFGDDLREEGFPVQTVLYEELLADPKAKVAELAEWIGLSENATSALLLAQGGQKRKEDWWLARRKMMMDLPSEPDLDLENFNEYRQFILSLPSPGRECLLQQLYSPDGNVFPVCDYPFHQDESPMCTEGHHHLHVDPEYQCKS